MEAKDIVMEDDSSWYGWTDVLPEGTKMLVPTPCAPSGDGGDKKTVHRDFGERENSGEDELSSPDR